jgi:alkylhydroperoxidase/carboxymuconolactone decarboxylase family protein YurZ
VTRIPQRTADDTDGETGRVLGKLEASGNALPIVRLLANSTHAFRPFVLMGDALLRRAVLPARTRELVILALAAERGAGYEWAEHVPMSADAGVTDAERDALTAGFAADLPDLAKADQLALDVARQLCRNGSLDDDTWAAVGATWDADATLDLVMSIGWWGGFVPTVIAALGVEAELARGSRPAI